MQGFNMGRYVPPDLEGTTSFNAASGKGHALGSRARKLKTEGVLVVRFECPFAIWCTNCQPEQIIGQGVRFNAEKKKVGNYYSTPIWSFKFKHTVCGKRIEVHTDPKTAEYVVVEGGRRRDTGIDKLLDGEIRLGATEEEKERLEKDGGFGLLEKTLDDKREANTQQKRIDELAKRSERDWADPYEMSRKLRKEFRVGRRQRQADEKSGELLQEKFGLGFDLLAPDKKDAERAAFVDFENHDIDSDAMAKPMFTNGTVVRSKPPTRDRGKRGQRGADELAARKASFRSMLTGNTRSVIDPFLSGGRTRRSPIQESRAKRQRVDAAATDAAEATVAGGDEGQVPSASAKTALVSYDSDSS